MAQSGINLPQTAYSSFLSPNYNYTQNFGKQGLDSRTSTLPNNKAMVSASVESYTDQKYALEFTTKDGDKVSLSFESIEYSKSELSIESRDASKENLKKMSSFVKDQLSQLGKEVVRKFLKDSGVSVEDNSGVDSTTATIPDYWNAENTSQRIVDFALSFFDSSKGNSNEFVDKIKNAIENGFDQAKKTFGGAFPGAASKLVNDTHDLIMEKLDKWASVNANESVDNAAQNT